MQDPHAYRTGDLLRVRGDCWRVTETLPGTACTVLRLAGAGSWNRGRACALLVPFDRPAPVTRRDRPRIVRRSTWMRALRSLLLSASPAGRLRAAARGAFDLMPFQLEPALAVLHGVASRVLLADEVGLGKTVQAGILLIELRARAEAGHVLIVVPAGLREQWQHELRARFDIDATIVDALHVRRSARELPAHVNPWTLPPVVIASFDFVKRPEVIRALEPLSWDLLIVDEAHNLAGTSDRAAAARALGARARRVALLTATPHAGDARAYDALCSIGRLAPAEPLVVFRRSRAAAGRPPSRRVRLLRVRRTNEERRAHALLDAYSRLAWQPAGRLNDGGARLAIGVLQKRALSSATALAQSAERRLRWLQPDALPLEQQLPLPLAAFEPGEVDEADAPPEGVLACRALDRDDDEHARLEAIARAARQAACRESKLACLLRLVRRVREPVIVFTEYRDTAMHVAARLAPLAPVAVLHGGLDRQARRDVERDFNRGPTRVLVATDAAGEGLNLQERCRLVINLELPWNPMRLEQRIGRVDRLGQRLRVHAIHLLAAGTAEEHVLGRLIARVERARRAVGFVPDPLGLPSEETVAEAMINGTSLLFTVHGPSADGAARSEQVAGPPAWLSDLAIEEAARVTRERRLVAGPASFPERASRRARASAAARATAPRSAPALLTAAAAGALVTSIESRGPFLLVLHGARRRRAHQTLAIASAGRACARCLALYRLRTLDRLGQLLDDLLVPLEAEIDEREMLAILAAPGAPARPSPHAVWRDAGARLSRALPTAAASRLGDIAAAHLDTTGRLQAAWVAERRHREQRILDEVERRHGRLARGLVQSGLFDHRADRQAARSDACAERMRVEGERRLAALAAEQPGPVAGAPECLLLLLVV